MDLSGTYLFGMGQSNVLVNTDMVGDMAFTRFHSMDETDIDTVADHFSLLFAHSSVAVPLADAA